VSEKGTGVELQRRLELLFGLGSTTRILVELREKNLSVGVQGIQVHSTKHFLESRLGFALNAEENAVPLVGHAVVGIEIESFLDLSLSPLPVVVDGELFEKGRQYLERLTLTADAHAMFAKNTPLKIQLEDGKTNNGIVWIWCAHEAKKRENAEHRT